MQKSRTGGWERASPGPGKPVGAGEAREEGGAATDARDSDLWTRTAAQLCLRDPGLSSQWLPQAPCCAGLAVPITRVEVMGTSQSGDTA